MDYKTQVVRRCESTDTDITLAYTTYGDAKNPPLVVIHGLNCNMGHWDEDMLKQLADEGNFYVVCFDNRDVGNSTKFDGKSTPSIIQLALPKMMWGGKKPPYSLHDMAKDCMGLMDHLKIDKAHFLGVSMGGMIAQTLSIHHSERVLSLTSIMSSTGGKGLPDPPFRTQLWFLKTPKSNALQDLEDFRVQVMSGMLCTGATPDETFLRRRAKSTLAYSTYRTGVVRQLGAITAAMGTREPGLKKLHHIPSLVIHGEKDRLVPVAHGYRTASCLPNAKLVVLPEMGHFILPEDYGQIVAEVKGLAKRATSGLGSASPSLTSNM